MSAQRVLSNIAFLVVLAVLLDACRESGGSKPSSSTDTPRVAELNAGGAPTAASELGTQAHRDRVMMSVSCAGCHPAIYAEHELNTHGRAFHDEEARLATRDFRRDDCVRCHTPRPVFETGIGLTPMQRWTDLQEGNTCMSCHFKDGYDYSRFEGGKECTQAFDPRVGSVQACASCHRIAGTPDQWSRAERGQKAGKVCLDCHMKEVERPVAVGEPSRKVRSHVFPASRSEDQLRRAYEYEAKIEGNEVVVKITNRGAGHNFPTATRQRAVESLVTVRDVEGKVIGTSRLVCRYPYASELAPGQLTMPVGTQIPSGKTKEHRVPLPVAGGSVECELFFKLYRPIGDFDPQLSRRLEDEHLYFDGIAPNPNKIEDAPIVGFPAPQADIHDFFDPNGYSNVARPAPKPGPIEIPQGDSDDDIARLVSMLEFHLPEARRIARERLVAIGAKAYPALIQALGAWSNESYNEAMEILVAIGPPAVPSLVVALKSDQLYIRCHSRFVLARIGFPAEPKSREEMFVAIADGLSRENALDRRSTSSALGDLADPRAVPLLLPRLDDPDWDVVAAAARSLARFDAKAAIPQLEAVLARATFPESKHDLGLALAQLGAASGIAPLLDGMGANDPVVRASFFEAFYSVTGQHFGYDPAAPDTERLESLAKAKSWWEQQAEAPALHRERAVDAKNAARAREIVLALGGGTDTEAGGDDAALLQEITSLGQDATTALIEGLTFPSGFVEKRKLVCQALGAIGDKRAAPFVMAALRDPSLEVAAAACEALERAGDPDVLPAVQRFAARGLALTTNPNTAATGELGAATAARTRLMLGDPRARTDLVNLLMAEDEGARDVAITALEDVYGERRGYDPSASRQDRIESVKAWQR